MNNTCPTWCMSYMMQHVKHDTIHVIHDATHVIYMMQDRSYMTQQIHDATQAVHDTTHTWCNTGRTWHNTYMMQHRSYMILHMMQHMHRMVQHIPYIANIKYTCMISHMGPAQPLVEQEIAFWELAFANPAGMHELNRCQTPDSQDTSSALYQKHDPFRHGSPHWSSPKSTHLSTETWDQLPNG